MNFDIFNEDAFSLSQLSHAMVDLQHTPTLLGDMNLFQSEGINTPTFMIEKMGQSFTLVPAAERGAPGRPVGNDKRSLRNFSTVHLPQRGAVNADEVYGVRAFGSSTELMQVQTLVNNKLTKMKRNIDLTMEWHRMGAIKGQVLDADATTVLLDLYTEFGVVKNTMDFELDVDGTKIKQKSLDLERKIEDELDGIQFSGIEVLCSPEFFDKLVQHPAVEKAYELFNANEHARTTQRKTGFRLHDITYREYRGKVGATRFIEAGKAHAIPLGVPDMFIARFAPAPYLETVNTMGLPYYAKQWIENPQTRVELEAQANPVHLNTRPRAVVELSI